METPKYIRDMITYARKSVNIDVEMVLPDVAITALDDPENCFYMQEESASSFLEIADHFYEKFDLTHMESFMLAAYTGGYVDAL